ncbi:uncharacterized protein LOC117651032 [Thrips palmi]|uniref:Uncharacterized protein LOC117651032 n=1 Tax=Thrips palmi TaxID=161013 RepID=A0A6P8ZZN8_THRPL|nr:uncharacterized protein LOC117651032 [Thrips palmi]
MSQAFIGVGGGRRQPLPCPRCFTRAPRPAIQLRFDALVEDLQRGLEAVYPRMLFRCPGVPPLGAQESHDFLETTYLVCPQLVDKPMRVTMDSDFLKTIGELEETLQTLLAMVKRDHRLGRGYEYVSRWPLLLTTVQWVLLYNLP